MTVDPFEGGSGAESLDTAGRQIGALDDEIGLAERLEGVDDLRFPLSHPEGRDLKGAGILVAVDDEAAEFIAFGIGQAVGRRLRHQALPMILGCREPPEKEPSIDFLLGS